VTPRSGRTKLRFTFCKRHETLDAAAAKLEKLKKRFQNAKSTCLRTLRRTWSSRTKRPIASRPHAEFAGVAECAEERHFHLARQHGSERLNGSAWRHHRRALRPLRETRHALSSRAPTLFPRTPRFRVRSEDV